MAHFFFIFWAYFAIFSVLAWLFAKEAWRKKKLSTALNDLENEDA